MSSRAGAVLNVVEDDWWSARELTIALSRDAGLSVLHLVRDHVAPDVRRMITPHPNTRITSIARPWFVWIKRFVVHVGLWTRRWRVIIVDNERTYQSIAAAAQRCRVPVIEARERYQVLSYTLNGQVADKTTTLERVRELLR